MDPETKAIYEILSCWFVNKYWGNMYFNCEQTPQSYKKTLLNFNSSFRSNLPVNGRYDTPYVIIIEKICEYYNKEYSRNKNILQFISSIYNVIVDDDNTKQQIKEQVVNNVLIDTVNIFTMWIVGNEIESVMERNKDKPIEWKNKFELIFKNNIKRFRHILLSQKNGINPNNNIDQEMVPVEIVEKLKGKISDLYVQLKAMTTERNQLLLMVKKYKSMVESQVMKSSIVEVDSYESEKKESEESFHMETSDSSFDFTLDIN